jgi:Fic family protein
MKNFNPAEPYDALPLLPPKAELESPEILKATIGASRVLAELKGMGGVLPNQSILVNSIVLQEARLSSEIENIVTTNDELYRAADLEGAENANPHTKEVLRYREALWHGFDSLRSRPLSTNLFVEIVQIIRKVDVGIRKIPGTHIAKSSGEVIYTPPVGEPLIREKLANLERYIHEATDVDPLIRMAVMHYQFEAIHPFTDGNGRTGRILNILYLVEQGLLDLPVLYLSHSIIRSKDRYYEGLRRVTREGAWAEWVLYMLEALRETAEETRRRILRIRELMEETGERVRADAPGVYSKELVELIFTHPYSKILFLEQAGLAKRQTASKYLKELEKIGVLTSLKAGREVYYVNTALMEVLSS